MLKRKKTEPGQAVSGPRATASAPDAPTRPHSAATATASAPAPADAAGKPRTTCYPQDAEAPPAVVGQPRTTVYRQAVRWNRGGYDTTN
jgi:hypothetical protein